LAPAPANLLEICPMQMAPEVADSKGGTLLQSHQAGREVYDQCRLIHQGLIDWAKDAAQRCAPKGPK
jgi:hypothetical protein